MAVIRRYRAVGEITLEHLVLVTKNHILSAIQAHVGLTALL
jgi:hypothetical protein